jgi:hypothetical protein
MTWLLKLYPPRWRQRYGREFTQLMAGQPFSIATVVDVMAGAIDAWIYPQSSTAKATDSGGESTLMTGVLKLRCAGAGAPVTAADSRKAAAMVIGGTLLLTLLWTWGIRAYPENPYVSSIGLVSYIPPYLLSMRYTTLKGRPGRVQAVFIGSQMLAVMAIMIGAAWLGQRI